MFFNYFKQGLVLMSGILIAGAVLFAPAAYADVKPTFTALQKHGASSGGKGVDSIRLRAPKLESSQCAVFKSAKIIYKKRRFGEARISKHPGKGCNPAQQACRVSVAWKHAPAGRLNYQVQADWTVKAGC